jgi:hypothetical protein
MEFLHKFHKIADDQPRNTHVYAMKRDQGRGLFVPELQSTVFHLKLWEKHIDIGVGTLQNMPEVGMTEFSLIRTLDRCLSRCARDAVEREVALETVRFDSSDDSCRCFEADLFHFDYDTEWVRDETSVAEWHQTAYCEFTRPDESGRTLIYSKRTELPTRSQFCVGSPVGMGYTLESSSVRESFHEGVSSAVRFAACPICTSDCLLHATPLPKTRSLRCGCPCTPFPTANLFVLSAALTIVCLLSRSGAAVRCSMP